MSEVRRLLYTELKPYTSGGQVVGVKASLNKSLSDHVRRLIQTGQASFLPTTRDFVCEVTVGVDGRGDDKAGIGKLIHLILPSTPSLVNY